MNNNFQGLDEAVVISRLQKFGKNIIAKEEKDNKLALLLKQLRSPLIFILILAAAISFFLEEVADTVFILLVVVINTTLGFIQESKAESTLKALKQSITSTVKVIRGGHKLTVDSQDIVPGDLIILEPGLRIPADAKLVQATELLVDESILTGESEPLHKTANKDLVFAGTSVFEGIGLAEVTVTGAETKFGQIAANLASEFDPETPIKRQLRQISNIISVFMVILTALIVVLGIMRSFGFNEIFLTAVAVGVSTIPEGLIISLTLTLAVGMNRIMARKAIVRNLPAAETLGGITVLGVDKTGTLTFGTMRVTDFRFTDKTKALKALAYCNNDTNFIDKAIAEFVTAQTDSLFVEQKRMDRLELFPFSSKRKYAGAFTGKNLYATGAPEILFEFCNNISDEWTSLVKQKSEEGFRIIAVAGKDCAKADATREDFNQMDLLGLIFVIDPVRPSAKESISKIIEAGIAIKVITGDLQATAVRALHELGFVLQEHETLSGQQLEELKDKPEIDSVIAATKLFYRTTPDQKLLIVQSLQSQGKVVGMMGDGVNDSPALKRAEIAITVDNATDISKEVSDIVLLDSNFETIVAAVSEGRNIFLNLRKIMTYLFADSVSETILIILSIIFGLPLPLLPLQLLWINVITDGLPGSALSFDRTHLNLLKNKPRGKNESVLDKTVIISITIISVVLNVIYFVLFKTLIDSGYDVDSARTMVFAGIALSSLLFLFSAKTIDTNIWKENIFNNRFVNLAVLFGILSTLASIYLPVFQDFLSTKALSATELLLIVILSFADVLITEVIKMFIHKFRGN